MIWWLDWVCHMVSCISWTHFCWDDFLCLCRGSFIVWIYKLLVRINNLACLNLQAQTYASVSAELRQVANGCAYRVKSFGAYDVNGYRFHTTRHEQSWPNRRTTNYGVFTPGDDGLEYYGRIEEIYELTFHGSKPLKHVIFKCYWFDPHAVRRTPNLGLVEVQQASVYPGDDVYIVAQQATQVYYLSYPCKMTITLWVGTLCTRYHHTVKYLLQIMRITT